MQANEPLLLFYTPVFEWPIDAKSVSCDLPGRWTHDRRRIAEAAAVIFHIPNFREFGDARKYPGQMWVAWSAESSLNYPMMRDPAFMAHFDLRMTYESDADIWAPYLPRRAWWEAVRKRPVPPKTSSVPVAMFQSSAFNLSGRDRLASELLRYIAVDSYGRFLNNKKLQGPDLGSSTKIETIGRYPFCIAFENSTCPDYVTEKLFDPLWAGTVPVYLGASNVRDYAPEHSYVDASDFSSPRELAAYLEHLLRTPAEYNAYFEWRTKPFRQEFETRLNRIEKLPFCRLLEEVHERLQRRERSPVGRPILPFGGAAFLRTRMRRLRKRLRSRPRDERTAETA